jgi:hypothetical protein
MPIYMNVEGLEGFGDHGVRSVASGPGDESPVGSGPGDENPVASRPGDESPVGSGPGDENPVGSGPGDENPVTPGPDDKPEFMAGDDRFATDSFVIDSFAAPVDPSDPSDGLLPMESLRPVDPSDPSHDLPAAELSFAEATPSAGAVATETTTLVHEGWDLLI